MHLRELEMEKCGFAKFTELVLNFEVINEDYEQVALASVTVYPYGEEEAKGDFVREAQEGDQVLVDNEYISVVVYGCEMDEDYGAYYMRYYAVNKTDAVIWIDFEDVSINGTEVSAGGIDEIYPSVAWFGTMYVWDTELKDNKIDAIEQIDFTLSVETFDDRYEDNDEFVDEEFTVKP